MAVPWTVSGRFGKGEITSHSWISACHLRAFPSQDPRVLGKFIFKIV